MRLPIIPNPPSLPEKETPSPSPLTQDARCPSSYLSYGARNGRPAATVPLSPNRILISSTETGNHAAPGQASITPGQGRRKRERPGKASVRRRNRERRRRPGAECAGAPFPGTFTSRCRPRPGAGGVSLHVGGDATADSPSRRGAPIPRACEPAAPESTGPKCRSPSTRTHRFLQLQRPKV